MGGRHRNLARPNHLSLLNQTCAPGNLKSSPCWEEIQTPSLLTESGERKVSHPLMGNPKGSTRTIPSLLGAFYSHHLSRWKSAPGITPAHPRQSRRGPATVPPRTRRNGKAPPHPTTKLKRRKAERKAGRGGAPPASLRQRGDGLANRLNVVGWFQSDDGVQQETQTLPRSGDQRLFPARRGTHTATWLRLKDHQRRRKKAQRAPGSNLQPLAAQI